MKELANLTLVEQAIVFAVHAHQGMVRKGTSIPYILHPLEAASIVATMTTVETTLAAAILHDVLEDTHVSYAELKERFGKVADLVAAESENKRDDVPAKDTWDTRKLETIEHLSFTTNIAEKMVALGDKLSNMRALYRDSLIYGDELWERFNQNDKNKQAWYYRNMVDALSELKKHKAWQELDQLVELVFGEEEYRDKQNL